MTALSQSIALKRMGSDPVIEQLVGGVVASDIIYSGSLVVVNASGYFAPAGSTGNINGCRVVGVSVDEVDNSDGSDGDLNCTVYRGTFRFDNSSSTDAITIADIGKNAYVVDDHTVARTSSYGYRNVAGKIMDVDSDGVWIEVGVDADSNAIDIFVVAAANLAAKQFYAVTVDASGADVTASAGGAVTGILQNAPASGAIAIVRVFGETQMIAGGALSTIGTLLASTSAGKAKAVVASYTNTSDAGGATDALIGSYCIGTQLTTAGADGDTFKMLFTPMGAVPTTAA